MTGPHSIQQYARVSAAFASDTPVVDRWDGIPLIGTRCIPVDSDRITTMTADEWDAFVAAKYGKQPT